MMVEDSIIRYDRLIMDYDKDEISALIKVCKLLRLPQKTIAAATFLYFQGKRYLQIEPDNIVLGAACINLATRILETFRQIEKILQYCATVYNIEVDPEIIPMYIECINKTELDICIIIDFDFELPNFYEFLEYVCKDSHLDIESKRRSWIILNDILTTPIGMFFTVQEIVYSCLCLSYTIKNIRSKDFLPSNKSLFERIMEDLKIDEIIEIKAIDFICSEILYIYEKQGISNGKI